jgi:UPF0755 protein
MAKEPVEEGSKRWSFGRLLVSIVLYVWAGLALIAVAAGLGVFLVYDHVTQPGTPGPEIEVTIPEGATGQQAGEILAQAGLLGHPGFLRLALRLDDNQRPIVQGNYKLPRGLSPMELLHLLQEGPSLEGEDRLRVTVPEGLSLQQAAALFDQPEAFLAAAADPALIKRIGVKAKSLEGFLMPETYFFTQIPTEAEVVHRMVDQFELEYVELLEKVPAARRMDKLEVVTIASMVEEEAKVDTERPMIAAVLYNRLQDEMPLQMDSTLQYALNKYGQRLVEADKEVDSPYNTYRNKGLPPGPISSPGVASIRAAMAPADVKYRYFVSNADGKTHTFSTTLAEHNRAVERFRREIAPQRRQAQGQQ